MDFHFITLFPEVIENVLGHSILKRAVSSNVYKYTITNPRDFATDTHKSVDDRPYGGGPGMVMRADILEKALLDVFEKNNIPKEYSREKVKVVVMSASGQLYAQNKATEYSKLTTVILISGHYEGIDQRFIDQYADEEISIGQYVLTGGELPSLVIADSIIRLLPGALGSGESLDDESFKEGSSLFLDYPHFTRPDTFNGSGVPSILISGNHAQIKEWRMAQSQARVEKYKK
jgi:tRNA (guanine37-N1)-methyltransferase